MPTVASRGAGGDDPQRPDKQALHSALRATLDALEAERKTPARSARGPAGVPYTRAEPRRRRRRLSVLGAIVIVIALAAAVGAGYALRELGQPPAETGAAAPKAAPRLRPAESERVSVTQAVAALRDVQSVSRADVPYRVYFNRVSFAKGDVDRHVEAIRDTELKTALSETMALHVLAAAAWRAKTLNEREKWEAVGDDPSIEVCAGAKRLLSVSEDPPNMSHSQWRGITLAAGLPLLWDCAGERLAEVERGLNSKDR